MLVCVQVIFNIAILILLAIAGRYAKKQIEIAWLEHNLFKAEVDKHYRLLESFKIDVDAKFGPDLIEKLNAIFKIGEHPKNLVVGKDGQFHKINREY